MLVRFRLPVQQFSSSVEKVSTTHTLFSDEKKKKKLATVQMRRLETRAACAVKESETA